MIRAIRQLSPTAEFAIVMVLAFGYFIAASLWLALHPVAHPYHSGGSLIGLAVCELLLMALLFPFLRVRGWSLAKIGLTPTVKDTGFGFLLFVATYAVWLLTWRTTVVLAPGVAQTMTSMQVVAPGIGIPVAIVVSLINPVFEEIFVAGYLITALRAKHSPLFALNASVAIRLLYHLYQGPLGIMVTVPMGLIFASWYVQRGRLWPLIVAHVLLDLVGLLAYAKF
jgi:membrane protease YdiL (CAAX protease family)